MIPALASVADTSPAYGLFPVGDFRLTTGECVDCPTITQALWFFRHESIAVPRPGLPLAGFDPSLRTVDDLRRWNSRTPPGSARDYPALVWVGSSQVIEAAQLDPNGKQLHTAGATIDFFAGAAPGVQPFLVQRREHRFPESPRTALARNHGDGRSRHRRAQHLAGRFQD